MPLGCWVSIARLATLLLGWLLLMALPLFFFTPPLTEATIKPYLGLSYALLLFLGALLARSWGKRGAWWLAFPVLAGHSYLALGHLLRPELGQAHMLGALNFLLAFPVTWLAASLGARLPSPARDEGRLG